MTFWRTAGLNYVQYSNIAANVLRNSLKSELKIEAMKRDTSSVRVTKWKDGKPVLSGSEKA